MTIHDKAELRIAILFHEKDRHRDLRRYDIVHVAKYWLDDGHQVINVFGTNTFVPADIAILHVDLSVVPQPYLDFAARYPICLNKHVSDIRKCVISKQLLTEGEEYQGEVIVKSNCNSAGVPERVNGRWWFRVGLRIRQLSRKLQHQKVIARQKDYQIFDHLSQVPAEIFSRQDLVVEKFLPERDGKFYRVRSCVFLGNGVPCQMIVSPNPVASMGNSISLTECEVHPEILAWRQQLRFDYGKFDYVIHEGKVVLLDANKTTGSGDLVGNPMIERFRKMRADGLLEFYEKALTEKK